MFSQSVSAHTAVCVLVAGVCSLVPVDVVDAAPMLCWTDADAIDTANRDGTNISTLRSTFPSSGQLAEVHHNAVTGQIYWFENHSIKRANYDGSNAQVVVTDNNMWVTSGDFALDQTNGHVYWTNASGQLRRAGLDGSSPQTLLTGLASITAIEVDPVHQKLFWLKYSGNGTAIYMSNLTGGNATWLADIDPRWRVTDLAVDPQAGRLYWSETGMSVNERVRRLGLGPGTPTVLVDAELGYLNDVTIDLDAMKLLMVDRDGGRILQSGLDGSNLSTLISGAAGAQHVTVLPVPEPATAILVGLASVAVFRRGRKACRCPHFDERDPE
jgi:hypothetical protein